MRQPWHKRPSCSLPLLDVPASFVTHSLAGRHKDRILGQAYVWLQARPS